ncbi:FKBP-type peptidyl-prolyl cis-trans isomerase [Neptuniibacter sp. 1_MG-2023]|uniref:FKBP-type peptidyl-prolyl cis-trans isomerase n=1 Tax=Neptuniibacter sp. 1_MG-2023 TaxID=3062662 RepID=UPI0026E291E3|nr:FKBP-type peptidyl-prolyl cis-trans isomerase [Neptuniibacter sp. 1_MG-2023]MDO6593649.1 FKBP-type peptidyl-prolyl cis-trans isomerase [Neptuniibacter sp. 1_MG-2023]
MKFVFRFAGLALLSALLFGCGEDAAEEKFRQELVDKALNDDVSKAGAVFLQKNALMEGVVTTKSGLQYKVLKQGEGERPSITDLVTVHYEGTRVDGHIFDSSYQRGEPSVFPLNRVIRGWIEGLMMMNRGSTWMLFVPSALAYGATSPTDDIPANSTLIFKVELIDFTAAE